MSLLNVWQEQMCVMIVIQINMIKLKQKECLPDFNYELIKHEIAPRGYSSTCLICGDWLVTVQFIWRVCTAT